MSTPPGPDLSVIVPVFDEADSIPVLAGEIERALDGAGLRWECVWVDDGSRDDTPRRLAELRARRADHHVVRLERNSGQSAAWLAGFDAARGRLVATIDGDLQNDPADLPRLVEVLEREGVDMVNGVRARRNDPWTRRVASRIANGFRNRMTGVHVTDVGCSLRVVRREYLQRLPAFRGMHRFLPVFVALEGGTMTECPVTHRPRRYGTSAYGIGNRLWVGLYDTFGVMWYQRRHARFRVADSTRENER